MEKIAALEAEELNKAAFVPMGPNAPQPAPPPMDPAMAAGGGMPMDPAMMGGGAPMDPAMMGGGAPMDPAMMGGGAPMDPAAMAAEEQAGGEQVYDMITQAVRQVMQEMGITGEGGGEKKEEPKKKEGTSNKIEKLETMMGSIMTTLGLPIPESGEGEGEDAGGQEAAAAAGFGMDSGMPADGANAVPMAAGPLDPNASMAMAQLDPGGMPAMPQPPKTAGFRPLDDLTEVRNMATALKRLRTSR